MAKRINFTVGRVADFQHDGPAQQSFLWDASTAGLGIRATAGAKSYIFEKRLNGRTVRVTIGNTDSWALPKAREEARSLSTLIDQGIDPREVKRAKAAVIERDTLLVKTVWTRFLAENKGRWSERHYRDNVYHSREPKDGVESTAGILWPLLQLRLVDINAQALVKWHSSAVDTFNNKVASAEKARRDAAEALKKWEADTTKRKNARRPKVKLSNIGMSNAALRQGFINFRAFWNWACQLDEYEGISDSSIFKHPSLKGTTKQTPKSDSLQKEDLSTWFEAVRGITNQSISTYLQILFLLGCRRNELTRLQWSNVDFAKGEIWLRDKVEQETGRVVPMTNYVRYILDRLPRATKEDKTRNPAVADWVFFSPTAASGHLEEPRIPHARAVKAAGLEHVSLHGLRRSFGTLSEWMVGIPPGITAQVQGHKPSATIEKHYRKRPVSLLAEWMQKYEDWILSEAGIQFVPKAAAEGLHVVKDADTGA
jgi:integrase